MESANRALPVTVLALTLLLCGITTSRAAAEEIKICDTSADLALGLEDYPAAIRMHLGIIRSRPNDALAHYHLGFAYGMIGRRAEEIGEYRTAAGLGLNQWDLFLNLGLAYLDAGKSEQARPVLEQAVLLGPAHVEAHFDLALVYEKTDRLGQALREVMISDRLEPGNPDITNLHALVCAELGDSGCARNIWTCLHQTAPDYAPARINLEILDRSSADHNSTFFSSRAISMPSVPK